jgi:hypothetical protein
MKLHHAPYAALLLIASAAFAQAPKPAAEAKPPAKVNLACDESVQPATGFTGCEILRIKDYASRLEALRKESVPIEAEAGAFIQSVVNQNPGMQYEASSPQFPFGRIVPIPKPAPPPTPAAATPPATPAPAAAPVKK